MKLRLMIVALACAGTLHAQEMESTVNLDLRQLRSEDRVVFGTFTQQAQDYINNYQWSGGSWSTPKVRMSVQIQITQGLGDGTFTASVLVVSQRALNATDQFTPVLRVLDQNWQFRYSQGAPMLHQPGVFNGLTSLFDFYVYLALGCDLDTRFDLGGNDYFRRAYDLCVQGQSSSTAAGWAMANSGFSRASYVTELGEPRFEPLRHLTYSYHTRGMDRMAVQPAEAIQAMHGVVDSLLIYKSSLSTSSVSLDRFLDAKYLELAQMFINDADKSTVYQELETIDPSHQTYYEDYRNK